MIFENYDRIVFIGDSVTDAAAAVRLPSGVTAWVRDMCE